MTRRLARLADMTPRELAHRTRQKIRCELERLAGGARCLPAPNGLLHRGAPRFYRSIHEPCPDPRWIADAVAEANAICRHEIEILGYGRVALPPDIDWHRDPITGRIWEERYWTDYDPVHDPQGRDSKIVHELNRHQHLPKLAKAWLWTGDERYATEAVGEIITWIGQNPPGIGINWQSSLEIAIRVISWLWTIFPLLRSRALDGAAADMIGGSIVTQLAHVRRNLSLYTSPNTHLIGEATALYIAGLLFHRADWLETGAAILLQEADRQILEDGVYGELSSYYHCYALDFYLQVLVLTEQNGIGLPARLRQRIEAMLEFLMHVTRPDGSLAPLGDDDGGRALSLRRSHYRSFTDALSTGAVLFGRGDFKRQSQGFAEETFWLLGTGSLGAYEAIASHVPIETVRLFPAAGYFIQRSGWEPLDSHMIFDCGGLGILAGGHAHADALSVQLFCHGAEVLIDPGTYVYNGDTESRSYFRSTRAHNTATVDGRDQVEQAGTFQWAGRLRCRTLGPADAEHDAYDDISHRRRVEQLSAASWVIVDEFRGTGAHTFDIYFHMRADATTTFDVATTVGVTREITEGWMSRRYGERQRCRTVRFSLAGHAPIEVRTTVRLQPAEREEALCAQFAGS